jgi:hypothetical protein
MQETEKRGKVGGGSIASGKTKRCRSRWWRRGSIAVAQGRGVILIYFISLF